MKVGINQVMVGMTLTKWNQVKRELLTMLHYVVNKAREETTIAV